MPELIWNGKEEAVKAAGRLPYRLLTEDRSLSYGADGDNMLIQGDNLSALKSLLPYYKGLVRCVFIVISSIISSGIRSKQGKPFFSSQIYLAKAA